MKTIVCYGDSNTWGFMPKKELPDWSVNRFPYDVRWPGILRDKLGSGYIVEEDGLNGRTTIFSDPTDVRRNGLNSIDLCMLVKMPVDLVIIMLGTNDVKQHLGATPCIIAHGIGKLVERVKAGGYGPMGAAPEILVVSPASLGEDLANAWPGDEFGPDALAKDAQLAKYYEKTAQQLGVHFLNAARFAKADPADCVHINEQGHKALGEGIAQEVLRIFR